AAPKGPAAQPATAAAGPYTAFRTTFPEAIGDPGLLSLLESHNVEVTSTTPTRPWFVTLLVDGWPMLLLVGFFVWMGRKAVSNQATIFGFGRSKARQYTSD